MLVFFCFLSKSSYTFSKVPFKSKSYQKELSIPATQKAVYSLGTSLFDFSLRQSSATHERTLALDIKRPILFKSTLSQHQTSKFANNLFDKNNSSNLNSLFSFINNGHRQRHYWGNLVSINTFKLRTSSSQFKESVSLSLDNMNVEHSEDAIQLIDFLIDFYNANRIPPNIGSPSLKSFQLKMSVTSFNYFLLSRKQYLLVLQLEKFNLIKTKKVIEISMQVKLHYHRSREAP